MRGQVEGIGSLFDVFATASLKSRTEYGLEDYYESSYTLPRPYLRSDDLIHPTAGFGRLDRETKQRRHEEWMADRRNRMYNSLVEEISREISSDFEFDGAQLKPENPRSASPKPLEKPKYHHVSVNGSSRLEHSALAYAVEVALIALGQQRAIPEDSYDQKEMSRQEAILMTKLEDIEIDSTLLGVLVKQTNVLLNLGPFSGIGSRVHPKTAPPYRLARYLFKALLSSNPDLAFNVGFRGLRPFIVEAKGETGDAEKRTKSACQKKSSDAQSSLERDSAWSLTTVLEGQQRLLFLAMIAAAGKISATGYAR